jgi:hypothetical protein
MTSKNDKQRRQRVKILVNALVGSDPFNERQIANTLTEQHKDFIFKNTTKDSTAVGQICPPPSPGLTSHV